MSTMQLLDLDLSLILCDENFNCRGQITPMDVVELARDIKANGLTQPVVVRPIDDERKKEYPGKEYLLIAGYRRYTSFMILAKEDDKWLKIPAVLREDVADERSARILNLSENLKRKELNIVQESRALLALFNLGMTEAEVMKELGMARGWVQVRFMVLKLPIEVQAEIAAGWLTQIQIRDAYSHYCDGGEKACFAIVREFKDDKLKGRKNTRRKPGQKKNVTHDLNKKKMRNRDACFAMQAYIYGEFNGNNIATRTLAWAAGEITTLELHEACRDMAKSAGRNYRIPHAE